MLLPPTLPDDSERARLEALRRYRLQGTSPEAAFDHVVRLAADLFEVPIALVSFVNEHEQVFKARVGFGRCWTAREVSFCAHAIAQDEVLVVEDALADRRFHDNPLVTGEPFLRFYAGAPIVTPDGHRLGSICVMDRLPRTAFTERQRGLLKNLARIIMDGLEQRRLDTVRRAAIRMAAAIPDAIVCSDEAGRVTFWNAAAERLFGHTREQILGQALVNIVPAEFHPHHRAMMIRRLEAGREASAGQAIEVIALRRNGTRVPVELTYATWRDGVDAQVGLIFRDLSERERAQERVRHLTHFDRLTDLPNRARFLEWVDQTIASVGRFAVLKVGLDRFKTLNGTLGMTAGDRILVATAERVKDEAGPLAFVARLGADEFGVLLVGLEAAGTAEPLARRLVERLGEPFSIGSSLIHISASVGVAINDDASIPIGVDTVLKRALLALQHAKRAGGRRVELFQPQQGQQAEERRRVEDELRGALGRGEFELHFQPQVTLPDARIVGAEALLRWRHPARGLLSPAAFLPILEASDAAVDVGRWILRRSCAFAADLAAEGFPIRVGVNLFAAQLRDASFVDDVMAALSVAGLSDDLLELEITETTVLGLDDVAIEPLRRLHARGISIAFDDYGTGYASLSLLKRYPLTRLKIDREFVRDLGTDPDDAAIVRAVIALGASLGLEVIAEGIETAEQASALAAYGCGQAQGYRFGRPMPACAFASSLLSPAQDAAA